MSLSISKSYREGAIGEFKNSLTTQLGILFELTKFRITFFVSFSTTLGFILYSGSFNFFTVITSIGVWFLAASSSVFNHFQEQKTDALMPRTRTRPLPSGKVNSFYVVFLGGLLFISGSFTLLFFTNALSLLLALTAFVWYNLIYTPLKRKTAFAVVPGSVIGALPPVIGYVGAGGDLLNPVSLSLAIFFFIWQIPHFWILSLLFDSDYKKAGFPVMTDVMPDTSIKILTYAMIIVLALSGLSFLYYVESAMFASILIASASFGIAVYSLNVFKKSNYRKVFLAINLYVLFVIITLSVEKLIST